VRYGADPGSYQADVYTAKAADFIRRRAPLGPFFLSVAYLAPHSGGPREPGDPRNQATPVPAPRHVNRFANEPMPRPPSFNELDVSDKPSFIRNRRRIGPNRVNAIQENYQQRLESLLAVDEGVASIVGTLQQTGELERTLVLVTADNGFFHGEHRIPAGKVLVYEPSVRVPLIVRGPGVPRNRRVGNLVANVDVAPTILDAADALPNRPLDGRSLFPLMQDPSLEWGRDILLTTAGVGRQSYNAIRTYRFVYVEHSNGERELYDLPRDPHQLVNVAGDSRYSGYVSVLARRLADLRSCSARGCRDRPNLRLSLRYDRGQAEGGGSCARGAVRATVRGSESRLVHRVTFYVDSRRAATDGRRPHSKVLSSRRFGEDLNVVRARASMRDGRVVTLDRGVRACS
jgi:N-acetylglucosamine-6-sulfatase